MPESALKRTLDFSNVGEARQPSAHVPAGDYLLEVEHIDIKPSTKGPWENANWQFSIVGQPGAGVVYENTTLKTEGLFRARDLIVAFGMKAPTGRAAIDFGKFVGKRVGGTLVDNTYTDKDGNERTNNKVATFFPASRLPEPGIVTTIPLGTQTAPVAQATSAGLTNGHAPAATATAEAPATEESVEELEFVDEDI